MSLYYECLAIKNVSVFIGGNKTQFARCCKILKIKRQYVFFFLIDKNQVIIQSPDGPCKRPVYLYNDGFPHVG